MAGILDSFASGETLPDPLPAEPMGLLSAWLREAIDRADQPNPNAMVLSTATPDGRPSARLVLCKDLDVREGSLTFFTNYQSRKAEELEANPRAACTFFWDARSRQARVEGAVSRVSAAESDAYFATRPWESRLGAWASHQSRPIASRDALLEQVAGAIGTLGLDIGALLTAPQSVHIPRPPHWGGYRVRADRVELWLGAAGRVHDRARWERKGPGWTVDRLQP